MQQLKTYRILSILVLLVGFFTSPVSAQNHQENSKKMRLKITIGDTELMATLYDNATAKDLIAQLPLTVELEDYASNEKIFYPKPKLSTQGAPTGYDPSAGDITYYSPWGDIAIFYKDFKYSSGLVSVGKIDEADVKHLKFSGNKEAKFELVAE